MIVLFNRISIYGLIFTALSMVGALMFIADLLYGPYATISTGVLSFLMFLVLWFVLPIRRRLKRPDDERLPL
jgi:membrane protein implicated in regulation of membrane protease activity